MFLENNQPFIMNKKEMAKPTYVVIPIAFDGLKWYEGQMDNADADPNINPILIHGLDPLYVYDGWREEDLYYVRIRAYRWIIKN